MVFRVVYSREFHLEFTPPEAINTTIEEFCKNFHLYESKCHVVCLSLLMTARWRKQLLKIYDFFVTVLFDDWMGLESHHEESILAFVFPFYSHPPWTLKHTKFVLEYEQSLLRLWENYFALGGGGYLRKIFISSRSLEIIQRSVVCGILYDT